MNPISRLRPTMYPLYDKNRGVDGCGIGLDHEDIVLVAEWGIGTFEIDFEAELRESTGMRLDEMSSEDSIYDE